MSDARTPSSPGRGGQHDFVDRLVSKAFGARDAAAPRLPSAFEPTAPGRAAASGRRGDDEARGTRHGTLHGAARGQGALDPFSDSSSHRIDELELHALDAETARGHRLGRGDTGDADARGAHARSRGAGAFDLDEAMRDAILRASDALGSSAAALDADRARQAGRASSDHADGTSASSAASAEERDAAAAARLIAAQRAASGLGSNSLADLAGLAAFADRADARGRSRRGAGDGDAGDSTHTHALADGEGTLGRSPFDARSNAAALAEAAARAVGRDAASLARTHDLHESAARHHARGADAERHDADPGALHSSARRAGATLADDVRALEGALLSRDRGLAQRLAQAAAAARGGDRASRRGSGSDGLDQEAVTVNVTIGRIDVRAVQTSAAAAPRGERARGPQPVALDDYLAQRGGAR